MARECGWTKDYIAENLTIDQIRRYHEALSDLKNREFKLFCYMMASSVSFASGNLKKQGFDDFVKMFDAERDRAVHKPDYNKLSNMGYLEEN